MRKQLDSLPISGYNKTDILDIRNIVRSIKFSCNDLAAIRERMEKAGYTSFSTFGRDCILNTRVIERVTSEQMVILNELIRERNNLNQIARACNAGRCWSVANEASALIRKMDAAISRFNEKSPEI